MNQVKHFRNLAGWSQEQLAQKTNLSLRTIQRIEKGNSLPKGHSLQQIKAVFPDIHEQAVFQNWKQTLFLIHLSQVATLFFPLVGIIAPLIAFKSSKNIEEIKRDGRHIVNFQFTWTVLLHSTLVISAVTIFFVLPPSAKFIVFFSAGISLLALIINVIVIGTGLTKNSVVLQKKYALLKIV